MDKKCNVCGIRFTEAVWCANADRKTTPARKLCPMTAQSEPTPEQRKVLRMDEEFDTFETE